MVKSSRRRSHQMRGRARVCCYGVCSKARSLGCRNQDRCPASPHITMNCECVTETKTGASSRHHRNLHSVYIALARRLLSVLNAFQHHRNLHAETVPTAQRQCVAYSDGEGDFVFALRASEVDEFKLLLDEMTASPFKYAGRCFYCRITPNECDSFSGVHYPGCPIDTAKRLKNLLSHASDEERSLL